MRLALATQTDGRVVTGDPWFDEMERRLWAETEAEEE